MQVEGTARYLRVKEVAVRFAVSPSTVYRAVEAGELPSVRIGGSVRIPEQALAAFEAAAFGSALPGVA
ncbi:helix-turn-helix domain-containing protein [Actinokineospora iranica]|uniref:DNA binding domain-containing protein, excisionase family n=1 Tax=Actinokineospora iranica TaxID=1271860 RepID=A0A1G6YWL3_9PSEU|nr:helix-turn-helix domain-containing protein [Actinokineospora iranica]SDD94730.1 DNA binding domain-containing protein, excisionase family [Actinokineospora iranica]